MSYNEILLLYKVIDSIKYMKEIPALPDCNDCMRQKNCKYAPKPGEQVRINCFAHDAKEGD